MADTSTSTGTGSGGTATTTAASIDAALSATRTVLVLIGGVMAAHGYGGTTTYTVLELIIGSIMVVGPGLWGMWVAWTNLINKRREAAQAATATATMMSKGLALGADGKTLIAANDGVTPPKPFTSDSAAATVAKFGPTLAEVKETDALNAAQLKGH